jgi:cytoskeletal protein CcmA (bactofilin family)
MGERGATLGTTLLVAVLILILGLTAASTGIFHLHFGVRSSRAAQATEAAEATIALTLERLIKEENFGLTQEPSQSVEVTLTDSSGRLSFSPQQAADWGLPTSIFNQSENDTVEGWNARTLPPECLQLIAVGSSGGVERTVEVVARLPRFPYAIAATGQVISQGDLMVGSIERPEDLFGGLEPEKLFPADVLSNANGLAIDLDGKNILISGNLESVGTVKLGDGVRVEGEVRPNAAASDIPKINLDDYLNHPAQPLLDSDRDSPTLSGSRKWVDEQLDISGGLTMDEGVLLVDGDLTIRGGVSGRGAIVARGDVTIHDGAALAGTNQVALLAGGNITVVGNDNGLEQGSYFQGTLYTEGSLIARDVTLVGLFLADGDLKLDNTRVFENADASNITVERSLIEFSYNNGSGGADNDDFTFSPNHTGTATIPFTLEPTDEQLKEMRSILTVGSGDERDVTGLANLLFEAGLTMDGHPVEKPPINASDDYFDVLMMLAMRMGLEDLVPTTTSGVDEQPAYIFELDLNRFLKDSDRLKIMLWEQH